MRRLYVSLILITGTSALYPTEAGVPFNGQKGEVLLQVIASHCRPVILTDKNVVSGDFRDHFTGKTVPIVSGSLPADYQWDCLFPVEWWMSDPLLYGDTVSRDLHNMLPLNGDTRLRRGARPIGNVVNQSFSNGLWSVGSGMLGGEEYDCYEPPESMRGRLARSFFYVSTLYHVNVWAPQAYVMLTAESYPGITSVASDRLLDWHRSHPADADEIRLNELSARLQGNRNPFIDYPELAEHLWGKRMDEPFVLDDEPQALRGVYNLSDGHIDLWSPFIPDDAVWEVNGTPTQAFSVATSSLGIGSHQLTYTVRSTGEKGRVLIKIVEK